MADVEMTPITPEEGGAVPPKTEPGVAPLKPTVGGLKPGLKLPPKPTAGGLKPGLKLPPRPGATAGGLKPGLKLPPKPTVGGLKPGLKLPPKPTVGGLKPGLKLPPKPGATVGGLKPVAPAAAEVKPVDVAPVAEMKPVAPESVAEVKPAAPAPVAEVKPAAPKPVVPVLKTAAPKPVVPVLKPAAPKPVAPAPAAEAKPAEVKPAAPAEETKVDTLVKPGFLKPAVKPLKPLVHPATPESEGGKTATQNLSKTATQNLKSVTGPLAAQAVLRKTGIIAEGILTPAQAQAAKSKTSRISLESAIGVAPVSSSPAPMKTIRLRRPTDIPPPGSSKVNLNAPNAVDTQASTVIKPVAPLAPAAEPETAQTAVGTPAGEKPVTMTQKKTLKLHRPSGVLKRPTVGGLKPASAAGAANAPTVVGAVPAEPNASAPASPDAVPEIKDLPEGGVADIPALKPLSPLDLAGSAPEAATVAGVPKWLMTISLVTSFAALIVVGFVTWTLFRECAGPAAGPNDMAFIQSDTDYRN